jgi:hypothetical protein
MSSETQYNYMEQKIREAASQAGLPYSDSAWKNMEKLLDEGKDRRKPFLWLVPALLVGLSVAGIIVYKTNSKKIESANTINQASSKNTIVVSTTTQKNSNKVLIDSIEKTPLNKTANASISASSSQLQLVNVAATNTIDNLANNYSKTKKYKSKQKQNISITAGTADDEENIATTSSNKKRNTSTKQKIVVDTSGTNKEDDEEFAKADNNKNTETKIAIADSSKQIDLQKALSGRAKGLMLEKTNKQSETSTNNKKEKKQKNTLTKFYVLGSYGGEITSTKLFSFTNTAVTGRTAFYLGYQINDRFAVQAGFASSAKKYVAQKSDYKFSSGSYWSNVDILSIDANCKVYEIPLNLYIQLTKNKNLNIFTSIGASAFIMKNEKYVYNYNFYGYPYSRSAAYTGNKHTIATSHIAIGIDKRLSNKLNFQFAPRLSIPLGGVGEGKITLYSTSVDIGIKYAPFKK